MKKTILCTIAMMFLLVLGVSAADLQFTSQSISPSLADVGANVQFQYAVDNTAAATDYTGLQVEWTNFTHSDTVTIMGGFSPGKSSLFSLNAGETTALTNGIFTVPSTQKAGVYKSTFSVMNGATVEDTHEFQVEVKEKPSLTVTATSPTVIQGKTGTMTLTFQNTGNKDLAISYSSTPFILGGDTLSSSGTSGSINLGLGQTVTKTITLSSVLTQTVGAYNATMNVVVAGHSSLNTAKQVQANVKSPTQKLEITEGTIDFGEEDRELQVSQTFTVKNTGDVTLNNLTVTHTINNAYNVVMSNTNLGNLAPGATSTVTMSLELPDDEDAGDLTLGTVTVRSAEAVATSASVKVTVANKLKISNIEVKVSSDKKKSYDDGDTISKVMPLDQVEFMVEVENLFNNKGDFDYDIEDITIELTIKDIDDGSDLEEQSSTFDVKADDKETETLTIDVPMEVDHDDEFDVEIYVEGEDENGALHTATANLKLKIEKEKHQLIFKNADLSPDTITCEKSVILSIDVVNLGRDQEDDVVLKIKNSDLDVNILENIGDMSEDYDDDEFEFQKFYTFQVPSGLKAGSYDLKLELYTDKTDLDEATQVTLNVGKCVVSTEDTTPVVEEPKKDTSVVVVKDTGSSTSVVDTSDSTTAPAADSNDFVTATTVTDSSDEDEGTSIWYLILLGVGNVVIVVMILVLIAKALRKN